MSTSISEPVVSVKNLTKTFGSVRALDGVDLYLRKGEVHGIVGENGAGKSTLMKILSGVEAPSTGTLKVRGTVVRFRNVLDAINLGIVMIHQELNLVDDLSITDNIFLGRERTVGRLFKTVDRQQAHIDSSRLLKWVGFQADPDVLVKTLSIAGKQLVEIAKALSYKASVLIMDEPTAALSDREVTNLTDLIHQLRNAGVTIVFISHVLPQVLSLSDRITVLRDGKVAAILDGLRVKSTTDRELASLMVGRPLAEHFPPRIPPADTVVLSVKSLSVKGVLHDVSFDVRKGEILGLAGLIGAGRTETGEAIVGLRRKSSGVLQLEGQVRKVKNPAAAARLGIAYLPEDRKDAGLALNMSIVDNTTMVSLKRYSRGLLRKLEQWKATLKHAQKMHLRCGTLHDAVSTLSGGNQQKVLLAKWLEITPKVLIVDEPTRGVDIGAKEEIYNLLHGLVSEGLACVMISSEINELLGMCHRIAVMRNGRIVTILDGNSATENEIIHAASLDAAESLAV
jgi:ribose transport system ATP-binding protein